MEIQAINLEERFRHLEHVKIFGDGRYAAVYPFLYTDAIIVGKIDDEVQYEDRWCYEKGGAASAALNDWDGTGEPAGWHRHPNSGRRRKNGDPATETVNP